jgi:hypothetical protein
MSTKAKAQPKTKPAPKEKEEGLYSISKLAEYFELDRSVLRKRLDDARIKPVVNEPKRKLYRLEEAEAVLEKDERLDETKLRKMRAETALKELELQREQGDLLPCKEVEDYLLKLFTALYQRVCVRLPRDIGPQLYKADSPASLTKDLQTNLETIFHEVRTDHPRFFEGT